MEFNEVIAFTGGINTDDTPQGVPKGDYRDFSYCRLGYNSGNAYAVETSDGTLLINNPFISIQDQIMGATIWQKQNAIVYFVFKANGLHEIWLYYIDTQSHYPLLAATALNFSREFPIYHANVIDDILKWTDGRWDSQMYEADGTRLFNPPYQINIQKVLDGFYTGGITLQTIDAIKWPMDPPRVAYFTDPTRQDNKLRNKLFKFIIQPIYENGEIGVWSMYSNLELPEQSELIPGTNWVYPNNSNGINIQFETGPQIIRKFNIAVQQYDKEDFGTEPPFGIFLQLDKDQDVIPNNTIWTVQFYGGVATTPAIDVFKNYDRLPITASCQEYLPTSQIVYTNFREGYDKPTEEPFILDVGVGYQLNEINWNPFAAIDLDITYSLASSSITTDTDDFNANDVFPFSAGLVLQGPAPTSASIGQFVYQITQADIDAALAAGATPMDWNIAIMNIICNSFMSQLGYTPVSSAAALGNAVRYTFTAGPNPDGVFNPRVRSYRQTLSAPSLKVGATHEFGIVYGDRAYRDSTVYTVDSMNLFVPWFYDLDRTGLSNADNPFTVNARFTIDHIPPVWADRYWIVAKPATEISSFGQYTTNANDISLVGNVGGSGYVSSIYLDTVTNNRYIINIDKYYVNQNIGASIAHEIKVGDKIRFIRRRLDGPATTASQVAYLPYLELDVVGYDPVGGEQQRQIVYTNIFDTSLIETQAGLDSVDGQLFGQLIEIYTPTPSVDDTGNLFVSTWKDVSEAIDIRNPHTEDRAHGAPPLYYVYVFGNGPYRYAMNGDYTFLEGNFYEVTIHNLDGTTSSVGALVTLATYNQLENQTTLAFGFSPTSNVAYLTIDTDPSATQTNLYQISNDLNSSRPATFALGYGDVYVKQRNYQTGMAAESAQAYYFIEDPNYSDYWPSNIHETGRTRIEDPNAKMTHRQATAIHSDSFIVGTQINGLSSFSLLNDNIEDMNALFGPVVRTYMSGREGKTLKCLQPRKENSIYIQFYPNEVGSDSTVRVSNKTFASWFDYKTLFGCSDAGANAILPDGTTMYFDNKAGVFMYSGANGQIVVSEIDPDTGKDYKFRTKTKELAASYNSTNRPVVRTYVNETVGEVGFAFRLGDQYTGTMVGAFNPPTLNTEVWLIQGVNAEYLYGLEIVVVHENGAVYTGVVTTAVYNEETDETGIQINNTGPSASEYLVPAYYYTTSGFTYDHVVFDYVNMRWRSTYDYNFQQFCNLGQTLVGWGVNNQMYLHNQYGNWDFHGQPFIQKISFVSNEEPLMVKRYQDITLVSDDTFSVEAYSEPNRSYPLGMKTLMPTNIINVYEGYGKTYYRKNLYDPRFFNTGTTTTSNYDPPNGFPANGWIVPGDQQDLLTQNITIIQNDGTIFSGEVTSVSYSIPNDNTLIELYNQEPSSFGINGYWYNSDRAMLNGEDMRANALTHNLYFDPSLADQSSVLFSVGIKGVLS
jgi:hypothetical protein